MSLVGFKGQNHPQQVGRRGAKPEVDNLATTPEMFRPLHERFGFIKHGFDRVEPNQRPPFGCCLLIWDHEQEARRAA